MSTVLLDRDPVIGVITNPNSKKNRRRHNRVAELEAIVGRYGFVRQTPSTDAINAVVDEFKGRGVDFWVSDGGDGALYWMLNKVHETLGSHPTELPQHVRYALPTNGGTIDYVARRAGVRGRAEDILKKLIATYRAGGSITESIVPSLLFTGEQVLPSGERRRFEKIGFASAVAGVGNRFFDKYYQARIPGPKVIVEVVTKVSTSYVVDQIPGAEWLAPASVVKYGRDVLRTIPARCSVDGRELPYGEYSAINAGAFKINLGGVLKFFPWAGKGFMHVSAGCPSSWDMIMNLPRMATGRRLKSKHLLDAPAKELYVEATGDELLRPNVDGEFIPHAKWVKITPGPKFRIPRIDAKSR